MRSLSNFTGELWGYARVSTEDQNLDMQIDALTNAGVPRRHIFSDKMSGRLMDRPNLNRVIRNMRSGDCLVVMKLDRLGRSAIGLAQTVKDLEAKGMHFRALDYDIDTTTSMGKLVFNIMAAIAELESAMISERTKSGMSAAKARGKEFGKKHYILSYPKRLKRFLELWAEGRIPQKNETHFEHHLTPKEIVEEMHKADRKAPKYGSPQGYANWKQTGFKGLDVEAANALKRRIWIDGCDQV